MPLNIKNLASRTMAKAYAGADNYASADKSDPFALRRAHAHIKSGLAFNENLDCLYSATETTETRKLDDGREYQATVYRDAKRP